MHVPFGKTLQTGSILPSHAIIPRRWEGVRDEAKQCPRRGFRLTPDSEQIIMATFPVFQVKEGEWTSAKFFDVLGVKIAPRLVSDPHLLCDFITNFQTRQDDVFVVTYPRSGESGTCQG